jgi:hypothetical protein
LSAKGRKRRLYISGEPLPSPSHSLSSPTRPTRARRQGRPRASYRHTRANRATPAAKYDVNRTRACVVKNGRQRQTEPGSQSRAHVTYPNLRSWEGWPGCLAQQERVSCSRPAIPQPRKSPAEQKDQPTSQKTDFPRWLTVVEGDGARRKNVPRSPEELVG